MNDFWNMAWLILAGLLPFLGFLLVCFVVMRAVFNVDRNERKAIAQWDKTQSKGPSSGSAHPHPAPKDEPRPAPGHQSESS